MTFALATARSSTRFLKTAILPRLSVPAGTGGRACLSIGDKLRDKERAAEDLYIRQQEQKFFEKKRAELEKKLHEEELVAFKDTVAPQMAVIENLLKKTNDQISDEGLEALARWTLGIDQK